MTSKIIRFRRSSNSSSTSSRSLLLYANRASDHVASSNNNNDALSTATIVEKALSNLAIHEGDDIMGVPSPPQDDDYARFNNAQDGHDSIQGQDDRNEEENEEDDDLPQFCLVPSLGSTTAFGGSRHSPMSVHDLPTAAVQHHRPVGPPMMPDLDHPTTSAPLTLPLRRRTTYNDDEDANNDNTRRSRLIRRCFAWSEDSSEDLVVLPSKRQRRTSSSSSWSEQQEEEEKLGNSWIYWEERVVHP